MHINIHPGESKPLRDDKFNDRNTVISFAISTMIEVYERNKEPLDYSSQVPARPISSKFQNNLAFTGQKVDYCDAIRPH